MRLTFRKRIVVIVIGFIIGFSSLLFTNYMAKRLRVKEAYEVEFWSLVLERLAIIDLNDALIKHMIDSRNTIPLLIMRSDLRTVLASSRIPEEILRHPDLLHTEITKLVATNPPKRVRTLDGSTVYIIYGNSQLHRMLVYFPIIQILIIIIFVSFGYITVASTKQDEQNRVWIGLAKETAHQLGTPTSSLLGWIEYLRSLPIDQMAVEEMNNDLTRLMQVVDRFSKIGSETVLSPANINEVVGNSVLYFRTRIPKNVTMEYNGLAIAPVQAMVNTALFEWVIENLLKNSLDALQGKGEIDVNISSDENNIFIDVSDTGKGIAKNNYKRIFEPGFSTKTRGWGLGLSLSKRIIESYHKGKIAVVESEVGKGTRMRVTLKKIYL